MALLKSTLRYEVISIENLKTAIFVHSILWMRKRESMIKFNAFLVCMDTKDIAVMVFGVKPVIALNCKHTSIGDSCNNDQVSSGLISDITKRYRKTIAAGLSAIFMKISGR